MDLTIRDWALTHQPRVWQRDALDQWRASGNRGIIQVVTGAGKTIFAQMCILSLISPHSRHVVVVIVPTITLLDQWFVSLREDLNVLQQDIGVYSGESRSAQPRWINLMVLNTARTAAPKLTRNNSVFLIVDECHRAGSPKNAMALSGNHIAALGLSATPHRPYDDGLEEYLMPALGPIVFSYGYNEAARDGIIVAFSLINVAISLLPQEDSQYKKMTKQIATAFRLSDGSSISDARVVRLLQRRARVASQAALRIPTAVHIARKHAKEKILIFHETIEAAEKINNMLAARGVSSTIYHSQLGPALRRDNLRLYRQGVFDVLVSCRALDEGTNLPETSVAIIASSTASLRQRIQRIGRVLRPAKDKQHATIYTIYATRHEEQRLAQEAQGLVEASSVAWQRVETDG